MNRDECRIAVAAVAVADYRVRNLSEADSDALVMMWARHLPDVPLPWALSHITRHYAHAEPPELTSGRLLAAFRAAQRLEDSRHQDPPVATAITSAIPGVIPGAAWNKRPSWFDAYMRACDDARGDWSVILGITSVRAREAAMAEARAKVAAVPLPYRLVEQPNPRERRCVNHETCVCPHTVCFDGWLETRETVMNLHGDSYEAVRRCPACFDVVLMQGEMTTKVGRRR